MQKIILLTALSVFIFTACQNSSNSSEAAETIAADETSSVSLQKLWETDTLLTTAESVIFDKDRGIYYVSCIGGVPPWTLDGDGFIAKIDQGGKILEQKWVTGLSGPKGLGLVGNILYVNDIDRLVAIDVVKGEIIKRIPLGESDHLNDIAVGENGELYVSDSEKSIAYKVVGEEVSILVQDTAIDGLNGIFYDDDKLLLAGFGSGKFFTFDQENVQLTQVGDGIAGGDGIEKYGTGFFISGWHGEVYYVDEGWKKNQVLDTRDIKINAADIEIVAEQQLLLVPTFFDNRVMAYKIVEVKINEE